MRDAMPDLVTDQFDTIGQAADGCDVIVGANAHQYGASSITEHRGIGCVTAVYAPVAFPSPDHAPPPRTGQSADASAQPNGRSSARLSVGEQWRETARVWNERALERVNANRAGLGLSPIEDVLDYVLTDHPWLAADPTLAPVPASPGRTVFQTGTWVFSDERPLPADLEAFLAGGEPPVYIGFGSMPATSDAVRALVDAAGAAGRRVVVSGGWAALDLTDETDCLVIGDVSHDVLFPRVAAIVHHGGAGTTAAAARAGIPQVVIPMFGDQFYWAGRVVSLGVGASTRYDFLTDDALTDALRGAIDPAVVERARQLAGRLGQDGAEVAARRLADEYGAAKS